MSGQRLTRFPKKRDGFTIFNPHYDNWKDCFEIEDGMFIKGKNNKGEETIRVCKLYQYQFSIQFSEESGVKPKSAIKRAAIRSHDFSVGTVEYESAIKIINYCKQLI